MHICQQMATISTECKYCLLQKLNFFYLGTRIAAHTEDWYKEPAHVNEAHLPSYRGQHLGKPRKLSYEDTSTPCK